MSGTRRPRRVSEQPALPRRLSFDGVVIVFVGHSLDPNVTALLVSELSCFHLLGSLIRRAACKRELTGRGGERRKEGISCLLPFAKTHFLQDQEVPQRQWQKTAQ